MAKPLFVQPRTTLKARLHLGESQAIRRRFAGDKKVASDLPSVNTLAGESQAIFFLACDSQAIFLSKCRFSFQEKKIASDIFYRIKENSN